MKTFLASVLLASSVLALPNPNTRLPIIRNRAPRRQMIPIVVGGPQVTFIPNSVTAAVGDVLQFQFSNGNHTVTQSTADKACTPAAGGVHSGHIPFNDGQTEVGTFSVEVTSTQPMFLYCATSTHCQLGQVMVVNPTSAKQVADYAKISQVTKKSVDGGKAVGGTVGKIALAQAAFVPAPPEDPAAGNSTEAAAPPAAGAGNQTAAAKPEAAKPEAAAPKAAKPAAKQAATGDLPAVIAGLGVGKIKVSGN